MPVLNDIEPKNVFHYFEELSQIPRGTFNTKAVSDYCVKFAKDRDLEVIQDELNNVIIKKPGTAGYENSEPVIIQGHLDMVCEKTDDSDHDFMKDPLDLYIEDGFVKARNTTLGADDGIAIAMTLALLDSTDIPHPPIEALFTIDEEVGMGGAMGIDLTPLKGKLLLNLDSESEDTVTAGCAGGFSFQMHMPVTFHDEKGTRFDVTIKGLKGGHSGAEIDQQRANANKMAGRLLNRLNMNTNIHLASINGGTKDNVITPVCDLTILTDDAAKVEEMLNEMRDIWKAEYGKDEPGLEVLVTKTEDASVRVLDDKVMNKVIFFVNNSRYGVYEFSRSLKGLVETSDNLGIINTKEDEIFFAVLVRSASATKLVEMKESFISFADMLDIPYEITNEYPAWMYKEDSKIRPIVTAAFETVFHKPVTVSTIHAGLECGLLSGKRPELDCVSYGPDMFDVHSFNERLNIESTQRIWEVTKEILKNCK